MTPATCVPSAITRQHTTSSSQGAATEELLAELQRVLCVEQRLIKVLPGMAEAAANKRLQYRLMDQFYHAEQHASRLERVIQHLGGGRGVSSTDPIDDVFAECEHLSSSLDALENRDAELLALVRIIGDYEVAAYENAGVLADQAEHPQVAVVLRKILQEKNEAEGQFAS